MRLSLKRKSLIREIIVEKETSPEKKAPLIKQICKVEGQLYGLRYGVVFDAQNRVLNCNGKKMSLSPQQCQILKLFLDAPDYTVTDEDIIKFIWKGQSNEYSDKYVLFCRKQIREEIRASWLWCLFQAFWKRSLSYVVHRQPC